jgi:UDP-glucose 4-epimerase
VFSAFIIKLLRDQPPTIYGTGEKRRDFVHVDDVNAFHLQCIEDERTDGKVFNLGTGLNYSINEIYEIVSAVLGSSIRPTYKEDLPGEALENLADISEAKKLGWSPRIDLRTGLRTAIDYIRKEMEAGRI